jgi:hypothetical protein
MPTSNSPVTNVASKDFICNAGTKAVSTKCAVKAGSTVTVEMHQVFHTHHIASEVTDTHTNRHTCSNRVIDHAAAKLSAARITDPCRYTYPR